MIGVLFTFFKPANLTVHGFAPFGLSGIEMAVSAGGIIFAYLGLTPIISVASEVRNLATRSASAAREIKALIQTSVERVQAGSNLAGNAGATMAEVVSSIQGVSALMEEISDASAAQTQDMLRVTQAIVRMDEATQQNAALVEESAAAAGSLSSQASQLVEAVAVFRLRHQPHHPPTAGQHALPAPRA